MKGRLFPQKGFVLFLRGEARAPGNMSQFLFDILQSCHHFIYSPQLAPGFWQLFGGRYFCNDYTQYSEEETEARAPDLREDFPVVPGQDSLVLNTDPDPGAAGKCPKENLTPRRPTSTKTPGG